jgi:hypothetical protein
MTAPEPRPSGADGNARGILVLVVAVAVGVLLLWQAGGGGGGGGDEEQTSTPNTTAPLDGSTTTAASDSTTTTAPSSGRSPSEVKVLVLNGGGPTGAAGATSTQIGSSGYVMGEPTNSPVAVEATSFFYAEDFQAEATEIALLLGKSTDAVKPLAEAGLGGVEGDANVVVVLGPDAPPVSEDTSSTTTTAAG